MLDALSPEWRFLVYPHSAIPQRKIDAFVVADLMADLIQGVPSSWGGIYRSGTTASQRPSEWQRLGFDTTVSAAGFARFLPSGGVEYFPQARGDYFGGFFVIPTARPLACTIDGGTASGGVAMPWSALSGDWETAPALSSGGTALYKTGSEDGKVRSDNAWVKDQGMELHLDFHRVATASGDSSCFADLGPTLRLALREGQSPQLERLITKKQGDFLSEEWTLWRRLDETENFSPRGTHARFAISQTGGRLVWEWNGKSGWLLDENDEGNAKSALGLRARAGIPTWGGAPLALDARGCKVRAEFFARDHLDDDGTSRRITTISRRVPLAAANSYEPRLLDPVAGGVIPPGCAMNVSLTHDSDFLRYGVALQPDEAGTLSPTLSQVLLTYAPVWTNGIGGAEDVSRAVTSARVTLAQPPQQAGAEGEMNLDMSLIARKLPGLEPYLKDFAPVEVSARWREDATGQPLTDYRGLMQGYLFGENGAVPGFGKSTKKFTLRSPIVRLKDEAGTVDSSFYDLILAYQKITKANIGQALKDLQASIDPFTYQNPFEPEKFIPVSAGYFYGADCVKELIEIHLGPNVAAQFNGNGDARRLLGRNHPPLLSALDISGAVAPLAAALGQTLGIGSLTSPQNGMFFPPPYGDDLYSWIEKIRGDDFCDFWFGHMDRDTDPWAVPLYGRYEVFLDSALGWNLGAKEAAGIAGLLEDLSYETRPENAINTVLVWSNPFGITNEIPNSPALVQGEARIARGPNAPQNTWKRTKVFREGFANWATTPGQASVIASSILGDLSEEPPILPRYRERGNALRLPGDVFYATGLSLRIAGTLISNLYCRAARVEHEYTADPTQGRWWTTSSSLSTMTRSQIVRFCRNNGLPIPS